MAELLGNKYMKISIFTKANVFIIFLILMSGSVATSNVILCSIHVRKAVSHSKNMKKHTSLKYNGQEHTFKVAVMGILKSMRSKNWLFFRHYMLHSVFIQQYSRIYTSDWNGKQLQKLFYGDMFTKNTMSNNKHPLDVQSDIFDLPSLNSELSLEIPSQKLLTPVLNHLFIRFCSLVIESGTYYKAIHFSQDLHAQNYFDDNGPAIEGYLMSDDDWRIDLSCIHGKWYVLRLLEFMH